MLEDYLDMFNMYYTEIIAGLAILVLSIIYYMLKKADKKKHANEKDLTPIITKDDEKTEKVANVSKTVKEKVKIQEKTPPKPTPKPTPEVKKTPKAENSETNLAGKEEGSFGIVEKKANEQTKSTKKLETKKIRTKRSVPPHGKIKKDDFMEFKGQRILVAEDNLINQKVIGGLLADSGIEIKIADDGQDALDMLEKDSNFNIILMDAHMPRVDGFEATRAIRKNPAYDHIVVVALSGDTAADDIKKMSEAGMEEHLEKPLRMDALYDILYAYTRNRASDRTDDNHEDDDGSYTESMKTKEIDTEKGLGICGYDEEFYNEILAEFVTTYSNSHIVIRDLLNKKQMKEADKYLLDISGTTSNIGATNISEVALALKNAINNPKERRYVSFYKQYVVSLRSLLTDINKYLS